MSGRKPRKAAPAVAGTPHPRNSSTGVQKPISCSTGTGSPDPPPPRPRTKRAKPANDYRPTITLRPFLVSLDWLTLNMDVPPTRTGLPWPWEALEPRRWWDELDPDRCYWTEPTTHRTRQFDRVTYVLNMEREKVMTIWSSPHDCRLHSDTWVQVQFANHTFPTGEWSTLLRMLVAQGCTLRGISRVDIAADGIEGEGGEFPALIETTRHANAKYYGKCDWIVRSSRGKAIGGEFGHRSSNKFIRAYRKKREMKRKGVKEHLVRKWEQALGWNPMDEPVEVNRCEVQVKGKEVRRYFPDEKGPRALDFVLSLTDTEKLVHLFRSMAVDMLDFRYRAERARDAYPVAVWDFSKVADALPDPACRQRRNIAVTDHTIKTGLRSMFHLAVATASLELFELCNRQAAAAGPQYVEWWQRKRIAWTKQYGKLIAAGDTRTLEFFHRLQTPDEGPELLTRTDWERKEQWEEMNRAMRQPDGNTWQPPNEFDRTDPDEPDPW